MKNLFIVLAVLLQLPLLVNSQVKNKGIPYIINYSSNVYKAHNQNWSTVQDKRGVMYFGNTMGVLEFDGQNWKLIPVKNNSLARSLAVDQSGRVYVGARNEFGYLKPDSIGRLIYVSLVDDINDENNGSSKYDIGQILITKGRIFFVGRGIMFKYESGKVEVINNKNILQAYEIENRIFVKMQNKGITEFIDGEFRLIPDGSLLKNYSLRAVLPYNNKFLFVTLKDGLFLFDDQKIKKLNIPIDRFLKGKKIITSIQLKGGEYVFGMFSNGLLITDKQFNPIQHIDTKTGLHNNQVYSAFQDNRSNIWLGLANGISELLTSLPVSLFNENYGLSGKVNSSIIYKDQLYIGTSSGVFSKKWPDFENHFDKKNQFQMMGEPVQVFNIDTGNNKILIAHTVDVRTATKEKHRNLKLEKTTYYRFLSLNGNPKLAIVGTKKGLTLLEFKIEKSARPRFKNFKEYKEWVKNNKKKDGKWVFRKTIKGFNESCRHIQIDENNDIWYSDKTKGIARLSLNDQLDSVAVKWYTEEEGIQNLSGNQVLKIGNNILAGTENGLYNYIPELDGFKKEEIFNDILGTDVKIDLFIEDQLGNIWFRQKRKLKNSDTEVYELGELIMQDDGSYYLNKTPFCKLRNNVHSVSLLDNNEIIIGAEKGFVHYDTRIQKDHYQPYYALLRKVRFVSNDSIIFDGTNMDSLGMASLYQQENQIKQVPFNLNDIRFSFSAPFYDEPDKIKFKFFLEGNDKGWSDWKEENYKDYSNLRPGDYTFHVIAKNIYEVESVEATYKFTILPPWYMTVWAFVLYAIALALLIWGIVRLSVRRLRLQKEHLEMVVKERTAEINQAKEEIEATNEMLLESNEQIKAKNISITASITYAKRIQDAMLPLMDRISQALDKYFILFKPRDIVSGDFYWFAEKNGKIIIATVDCTGHGVPGAFMSMIGSEILTTIVSQGITQPSIILDMKNKYVQTALKQNQTDNQDGMDMTVCTIDKEKKIVEFAGAKNPLIYIQNGELFHIKGDKQSIGGRKTARDKPFINYEISYAEHETHFYTLSDGYPDQFGGAKDRKFMIRRMKEMFMELCTKSMREQEKILDYTIENWMKDTEQTDDIIVLGFTLKP
ncbi:MAG: triple tyrosine motif-containing protein [Bacteroidota bacterium]